MSSERTLRVVQRRDGTDAGDDVVVVEELLQSRPPEEFDRVFREIATADPGRIADVPLYEFARTNLGLTIPQNAAPPDAITHLVVLYRALEAIVEERSPDVVEVGSLQPNYRAVVVDLAREHDVALRGVVDRERPSHWRGLLAGILGMFLIVVDHLFSLVWKQFRGGIEPAGTVFVPLVNRFDSLQPVMDAYEGEYRVVLPTATVSWLRDVRHRVPELATYDPYPLGYFVTPSLLAREVIALGRLAFALAVRDAFREQLGSIARDELGVPFDETLDLVVANVYRNHLPAAPNVFVAERMLEVVDPDRVVVGSLGSRQQAILDTARRRGRRTYHVPHTVTTGYEPLPRPGTVHFAPGSVAIDHLEASEQAADVSNVVPAGRPQLEALYDDRPDDPDPFEEPLRVVVATQPFEDDIRRTLIGGVLDALDGSPLDAEVVVKIHPNEETSFYEALVGDRKGVTVAAGDLHEHLLAADVVVTVNSNVGLESMILGTPCVCVNEWSPVVRARPWALAGPVPVLERPDEIESFFAGLDADRLADLRKDQHAYLRSEFALDGSLERIAEYVRDAAHPAAE